MSLKTFHIFFITLSTLLSAGLIGWGLRSYRATGDKTGLALAVVGGVTLVLLVPYGRWFLKKMKRLTVIFLAATSLLIAHPAWGCAVCYGDPASPLTKGMKIGILSLAVLIYGVLAGIAAVAITWARRARKSAI